MMLDHNGITEIVNRIAPVYELSEVYLFGSYARGDATEDSDFDFRIVGGNMRTLFDVGGLYSDFEDALGKKIDLVLSKNMSNEFYDLIKNEEILIYAKVQNVRNRAYEKS